MVHMQIIPTPDSHYRLISCKCGFDKAVYQQYGAGRLWRVRCSSCGHTVDKGCVARHDAQLAWNKQMEEAVS